MRRIILIALSLCLGTAALATSVAGADDTHEYKIELDNAFGLVEGSEVRVAGVNVGTVEELNINPAKRAVLTITTSGELGELGEDTTCSSEPNSLIAEYFIDCQPAGDPLPEGGTIPVEQVTQTVQPDLANNTLREPFKRRLQLILNEFGTALAGNPENLNAAIRRGAPALRELEEMLEILGDHNTIIRDLNADSDRIIGRLAERREDVARFVREARDTGAASASRRADLSRNFEILDDFLAELQPTLADFEIFANEQTPLLRDLEAAAPGLNTLAQNLPAFNEASEDSLTSLGDAAVVGTEALENGADEIRTLRRAFKNAPRGVDQLGHLLSDAEDPRRAVEIDARAKRDTGRSSSKPGTKNTMGYTALEGLLNYAYYQSGAVNQYDQIGHLLHVSIYEFFSGPCGSYSTGRDEETGEPGVPAAGGGTTTDPDKIDRCVAWLGRNQPGISEEFDLPRYHPSVCPKGTEPERAREELCDPNIPQNGGATASRSEGSSGGSTDNGGSGGGSTGSGGEGPTSAIPDLSDVKDAGGNVQKGIEDLLGIPEAAELDEIGKKGLGGLGKKRKGGKKGGGGGGNGDGGTTDELMNFLFGN